MIQYACFAIYATNIIESNDQPESTHNDHLGYPGALISIHHAGMRL